MLERRIAKGARGPATLILPRFVDGLTLANAGSCGHKKLWTVQHDHSRPGLAKSCPVISLPPLSLFAYPAEGP